MKKIFGILSIVAIAVALAACGAKKEPMPASGEGVQPPVAEDKGMFSSIKDALSKSISLKCDYTDPDGVKSVAYITKDVIRFDAEKTAEMPASHGIVKDNVMRIWMEGVDKGFLVDFSKMKASEAGETAVRSTDELIEQIEKNKEACSKEAVSESLFELPTGIEFVSF